MVLYRKEKKQNIQKVEFKTKQAANRKTADNVCAYY